MSRGKPVELAAYPAIQAAAGAGRRWAGRPAHVTSWGRRKESVQEESGADQKYTGQRDLRHGEHGARERMESSFSGRVTVHLDGCLETAGRQPHPGARPKRRGSRHQYAGCGARASMIALVGEAANDGQDRSETKYSAESERTTIRLTSAHIKL